MFPVDVVKLLESGLHEEYRPRENLSVSSHLNGSLRHAMLDMAGAKQKPKTLMDEITLKTGDFWHEWLTEELHKARYPFMSEIRVNPWLPEGWSGRVDWVLFDPDLRGWVLVDIKTTKGEGIPWIERGGAKLEHIWQVSAYWHALLNMGLDMVKGCAVFYLPKNAVKGVDVHPTLQEIDPLPEDEVVGRMVERQELVQEYLAEIEAERERWSVETGEHPMSYPTDDDILNSKLAPVQDRLQKLFWNKQQGVFDVKLVPHWSAEFCPFEEELCDCSAQGQTKIGHYKLDEEYEARKDYELIEPGVRPKSYEFNRRRKEVAESASGDSR